MYVNEFNKIILVLETYTGILFTAYATFVSRRDSFNSTTDETNRTNKRNDEQKRIRGNNGTKPIENSIDSFSFTLDLISLYSNLQTPLRKHGQLQNNLNVIVDRYCYP